MRGRSAPSLAAIDGREHLNSPYMLPDASPASFSSSFAARRIIVIISRPMIITADEEEIEDSQAQDGSALVVPSGMKLPRDKYCAVYMREPLPA